MVSDLFDASVLRRSPQSLARAIFRAEVPEEALRSFPTQTLYLIIKETGLHSCPDLLLTINKEQLQLLLDFDLWQKDRFSEDAFWEWLRLADEEHGLQLLQKILKVIDLKIVALLISRHVIVETFDEGTDEAPGPAFHTPDKGHTWIHLTIEDADRYFLLARFMALIFETDPELYYRLLSLPSSQTESIIEEEAYQDKVRRLEGEAIPSAEYAHSLNLPISESEVIADLEKEKSKRIEPPQSQLITPLLYESDLPKELRALLESLKDPEAFEAECSLIMNAAIIHFGVDFSDDENVAFLLKKVRGAINLGLEIVSKKTSLPVSELYPRSSLQMFYRLGLTKIQSLRKLALKKSFDAAKLLAEDRETFSLLSGLREVFPVIPESLTTAHNQNISAAKDPNSLKFAVIETSSDLLMAQEALEALA